VKKIESPYFVIFCEKRKSVRIMKKYHVLIFFLLKKRREKKRVEIILDKSVVTSLPVVFEESVSEADMSSDS
jgi:hypothetical protein